MPPPTLYAGLVAYWKFDALQGGLVPDRSGRLFDGTLSAAVLSAGGLFGSTALRTTSSTGKMTVPDDLGQRQSATQRITINVWINLDKALNTMWGNPVFVDKTGGGSAGYFLGVLPGGGNVISFRVHNSAGTPYTVSYTESATSGWVMVTGVYEGTVVRIYRNGVSQGTVAADGSLAFSTAIIDNIGRGFEGLIDELSIWMVNLTAGNVTTLYGGGAGLQLILPESIQGAPDSLLGNYHGLLYSAAAVDETAYIPPTPTDAVISLVPVLESGIAISAGQYLNAPYSVVDSPSRIFVSPNPLIISVAVDSAHVVTATANGGPTDATTLTTWWQIDLDGDVFVLAEREGGQVYNTNRNQIDIWSVPFGQDWRGRYITFWMQAQDDASQLWSSPPVRLTDPLFNNSVFDASPLPPGPPLGPTQGPVIGPPGAGVVRKRTFDFSRRS
jgi:Concanavalin A-like lectin/glucanases superfamily